MKQIEQLISVLEGRFRVKVEDFVHLYEAKESGESICQALGLTENGLRTVAKTLNLRLPKKFRNNDLALYYSRFTDSEVNLKLQEVTGDLDASYKDAIKLERQLLHTKRELQKYKSQALKSATEIDLEEVRVAVLNSVRPIRPVTVQIRTPSTHYADYTQAIVLSDLHFEECVSHNDVGLANSYDWGIAERRLEKVFAESLQAYRGEGKCLLFILGDTISGIIHDTLESTSKPTGQALAELAQLLAQHIHTLSEVYESVEVLSVTGNHGRISEQRKSTANGFNFEYLLIQILSGLVPQVNVHFEHSTCGYVHTTVGNKVIVGHHGDFHRAGYGAAKTLKVSEAIRQAIGVQAYHIIQGHTHTPSIEMMHTGGQYITNGSLIGANGYSHSNGFTGLIWSQTLLSFLPDGNIENIRMATE